MGFNEEDRLWINICKEAPDEYRIMVHSKQIYVVDMRIDKMVHIFCFNKEFFIEQLLDYVGCSVEQV